MDSRNKVNKYGEVVTEVHKLNEGDKILYSVNCGTNNSSSELNVGVIQRFTAKFVITDKGRVPKDPSRIWVVE